MWPLFYLGQHRAMQQKEKGEQPPHKQVDALLNLLARQKQIKPSDRVCQRESDLQIQAGIFTFAVCFCKPRYRVFRYRSWIFRTAKTCSTLARTEDPPIPGIHGKNVIPAIETVAREPEVSHDVVVVGGGEIGVELGLHA